MNSFHLLKRYLKFVGPYKPILLSTILLVIVWTTINLIPPWLVKVLIDDALPRQDLWLLNVIVVAFLFVILNHQFMSAVKGFLFTYIEQRINLDMNLHLFDHLMTLPIQFFNTNETGSLAHRFMQDVTQIRELISNIIVNLVVHSAMLLMLLLVLFKINSTLAVICISIAIIYGINVNVFKNRIYGTARDIGERTGELYTLLYQFIPGIRDIKGLQLAKYTRIIFTSGVIKFFRAHMQNYRLSVYVSLIADILPHIAWAVIIGVGGREVIQGNLSIGSLLAFANYLDRIYAPINGLSGLYSETQKVVPAMERVARILDTAPEFNTFKGERLKLDQVKGHLQVKEVNFGYLKEKPVLKSINLEIKPGSKIAIVGPSGCGKSTTAHLLVRFFDATSGSVYLDGINIKQINLPNYRKLVGIVPQGVRLFSATIHENILMGNRRASKEDVITAAKAANAHDFIVNLPQGYDTLYGEKGIWLSGGEVQRIVIARTILQNPQVLILDEATSSVDANSEALIQDAIGKMAKTKTLIVIAHRFSTVLDSDWIYVMDNGSIVAEGTHQTLVKENILYASLYKKQNRETELKEHAHANQT